MVKTRFKDRSNEPVFVYFLLEHKSYVYGRAALQLLRYIDIFMKYLAKTENPVTRADAVKAIETIFPEGGTDMIKGWAKEYADDAMLTEVKENVLEALNIKFSTNIPADVQRKINALNNRALLKKLLSSAIQSNDLDTFRKTLEEIAPDQPEE